MIEDLTEDECTGSLSLEPMSVDRCLSNFKLFVLFRKFCFVGGEFFIFSLGPIDQDPHVFPYKRTEEGKKTKF